MYGLNQDRHYRSSRGSHPDVVLGPSNIDILRETLQAVLLIGK